MWYPKLQHEKLLRVDLLSVWLTGEGWNSSAVWETAEKMGTSRWEVLVYNTY